MAFTPPTINTILTGILRDIRSLQSEADIDTDSDHYARSAAVSAAIEGLYQMLAWVARQVFPDTADEAELIHTAELRGIYRKPTVAAKGTIALQGTPGVPLLQGAVAKHVATGELFNVLSDAVIGTDSTATVQVEAQTPGAALNGLVGALTLTSPPLGMSAGASFSVATAGGVDLESSESLLARLLEDMRTPPAGGALHDYKRWAKEVDGVDDALVLPKRRGAGSVDIAITGELDVPPIDVIAACQTHIESVCSVIADVWVFVPARKVVDCDADIELEDGYTLDDIQSAAQAAYAALVQGLKPQDTLKRSQIEAMLSNLVGVSDRIVNSPVGNVTASDDSTVIGWIRPGVLTLGVMLS